MNIIHLDPAFQPYYPGQCIAVQKFDFPSGCEPHIKLDVSRLSRHEPSVITHRIRSCNDMMQILLTVDALRSEGNKEIHLFIPYLPFARQDRVMVPGEPLSIKVFANMINDCGFETVTMYDPHSEVAAALINNSRIISNSRFVGKVLKDKEPGYMIVSPDAGAYKKIFKTCQDIGYDGPIVLCNKIRDVKTGRIMSMSCDYNNLDGRDVYIIDDICDGGGTFAMLGQMLEERGVGKVNLIVSHGIFSKGTEIPFIDRIYTTNSFKDVETTDKLKMINICAIHS